MEALMMPTTDPAEEADNRRRERRRRVFKSGQIIFNRGFSVFECTIRNISGGGAMIEVPSMLGIPTRFTLTMQSGPREQTCDVKWRTDRRMGVAFALAN
jgi:PilZ domain